MLVGAKIGYPEQNWDPKSVTRNKTGIQNWLPGTNLGAKIGYSEQTWDPKLVTRNKPGIQNWLPGTNLGSKIGYPEGVRKNLLIVSGRCLGGVQIVSTCCSDGVSAPKCPALTLACPIKPLPFTSVEVFNSKLKIFEIRTK